MNFAIEGCVVPPESFDKCIANGGKVITKSLKGGKYIRLCKSKNGKWHRGEIKEKQTVWSERKKLLKGGK